LFFVVCAFIALMYSCASQSAIQGGPKDEKPPTLLNSKPINKSLNFNEKKIALNFDEFLQLKSVQQKFVMSPPIKENPQIINKGKSVIISFKDSLLPNTTYNLNFSDAIADLNEGNSINDFHFCFSTGSVIDSLMISGKVLNAITLKPEKNMFVMLYTDTLDSTPIKQVPYYIGKTNDNGDFKIENIKKGRYKIFALQDGNSNMLFDLPSEIIAFSDTIIVPTVTTKINVNDSITKINVNDFTTIIDVNDSIKNDSIKEILKKIIYKPDSINLFAFEEDRAKQFVKKVSRSYKNKCMLQFNRKGFGNATVDGITTKNFLTEKNKTLDSLTLWLIDSLDYLKDTITFQLKYFKKDSLNKIFEVTEPVLFVYNVNAQKVQQPSKLNVITNFTNKQVVNSNIDIILRFSNPVLNLTNNDIIVEEAKDSVYSVILPDITHDSLSPCIFHLSYLWKDEMNYRIKIEKNKIHDIYNLTCDSLVKSFKTYSADNYSAVSFSITGKENFYVFQIVDLIGNVVQTFNGNLPLIKKFTQLNPGKFRLKAFSDNNKNGECDTGFYLEHKLPEKIYLYPEEINLRSNWEIDIKWEIKD